MQPGQESRQQTQAWAQFRDGAADLRSAGAVAARSLFRRGTLADRGPYRPDKDLRGPIHGLKQTMKRDESLVPKRQRRMKGMPTKKAGSSRLAIQHRAELETTTGLPDGQIDTLDIPETKDWSGAIHGLFYRPVKKQPALRIDADVIARLKQRAQRRALSNADEPGSSRAHETAGTSAQSKLTSPP
jgi:hypothetical protein